MPFHTYGQFMVPLRACRIYISFLILCTGRCQLRLACVVSSVLPLPFVFLRIATQSVRFVFPSALFLSQYVLLIVIFLFLFSKPLFVTGRSVCEAAIFIPCTAICVSIKISYAAIRNIVCDYQGRERIVGE